MYKKLAETLQGIIGGPALSEERKRVLQPLTAVMQQKVDLGQDISLHFICTHKVSDNTPGQTQVYAERSTQIATEMCYVFSMIKIAAAVNHSHVT